MKNLRRDQEGATAAVAGLAIVAALLILLLAFTNGWVTFNLPSPGADIGTDAYTEAVTRRSTDVGLLIPIRIEVTGTQEAGNNYADLDLYIKPYHEKKGDDDNYVPTPEVISATEFDSKVGVKGSGSIYAVNGESFNNVDTTLYNTTMVSNKGVSMGYAQVNYHAWQSPSSPTPTLAKENGAVYLWTYIEHRQKGTNRVLESADVYLLFYVDTPRYNADGWSFSKTYTEYIFVPFTDYAVVEDIYVKLVGFRTHVDIKWHDIEAVTFTYWEFPVLNALFPGANIKLCQTKEVNVPTRITYEYLDPRADSVMNSKDPWSHEYTYKIR